MTDPVERESHSEQESSQEDEKSLGGGTVVSPSITLQKAVEMGEYDPKVLERFAEWHTLSLNIQFQFIRQGLKNRERLLNIQWAELANVQYFSDKPELQTAMRNIEKQRDAVKRDKERLYLEYSERLANSTK